MNKNDIVGKRLIYKSGEYFGIASCLEENNFKKFKYKMVVGGWKGRLFGEEFITYNLLDAYWKILSAQDIPKDII